MIVTMLYNVPIEEVGIKKDRSDWRTLPFRLTEVVACYTGVLDLFLGENTESDKAARPSSKLARIG